MAKGCKMGFVMPTGAIRQNGVFCQDVPPGFYAGLNSYWPSSTYIWHAVEKAIYLQHQKQHHNGANHRGKLRRQIQLERDHQEFIGSCLSLRPLTWGEACDFFACIVKGVAFQQFNWAYFCATVNIQALRNVLTTCQSSIDICWRVACMFSAKNHLILDIKIFSRMVASLNSCWLFSFLSLWHNLKEL